MNAAVLAFADALEQGNHDPHAFILLQDGEVKAQAAWQPYGLTSPHEMYSLSKSFCSLAAGYAMEEGRFALDDKVISFFPDDIPGPISENLAAMRVRDLLTMTTGHESDDFSELWGDPNDNWPAAFLRRPVPFAPGTHFVYNTSATYMVSAILRRATGQNYTDYLQSRLFDPLGIRYWWSQSDKQGTALGGTGLRLSVESIAKVGQKFLENDGSILPADYVKLATSYQVPNGSDPENDWNQGYGFQFWQCRHDCYRGDGAFGQIMLIMPNQRAVLALFGSTPDIGGILNAAWDILLPELDRGITGPITQISRAYGQIQNEPTVDWNGKFVFPESTGELTQVMFQSDVDTITVTLIQNGREFPIQAGISRGHEGITEFDQWNGPEPVWAQAQLKGDELVLTLRFTEMTQRQELKFKLGENLSLKRTVHGRFALSEHPELIGTPH